MQAVTIWHNARCSNSRGALELIRDAGFEPRVIDYINDPPDRATLVATLAATGMPLRDLMRAKEPSYTELGLDDPGISDAALIEAMLLRPALINLPIVITGRGTRLCRPPEQVLEILPA
ncbi:arsenate reductase (glutaredoxin) [Pseudoxanthomonas sp.]|uniref:arsenate reductase (glutaredoxin) n=1 Tax=Pseudoxanthomonas sp. TaxID=1871049 RepID=UPI00260ED1D0|nr:arsenate reductase (glutaredoxin) [Pseudoxanthomonas sp.]WDS36689.1 MAG: arsenate reductase (glutaredoxin) [Pseudoxanthomonas sp.]